MAKEQREGDQMRGIICGALMVLAVTTAGAEEDKKSANFLLPYCKLSLKEPVASNAFFNGVCYGAVSTIMYMFDFFHDPNHSLFCTVIPDTVTQEQAVRVVVRYGDIHPQETHKSFQTVAMTALHEAWPCKK
jgi:hypothetical protein